MSYIIPLPVTVRNRKLGLLGLGVAVGTPFVSPLPGGFLPAAPPIGPQRGHAWGPIIEPGGPFTPPPTTTSGQTANGSPTSTYPNSPVPASWSQNASYVDSSGAIWEYSPSQGTFINVGTPYNTGGSAATPFATTSTPAATAAAALTPTANQSYTASDGSVWQYNATTLQWTEVSAPTAAGVAAAAAAAGIAATSGAIYTAADGSQWQYNATTGIWQEVSGATLTTTSSSAGASTPALVAATGTTESDYQSVLDWLTQSTLVPSVPNWIMALGIGLVVWKITHPSNSVTARLH